MSFLAQYWFIAIPIGMELLSLVTTVILAKWVYPHLLVPPSREADSTEFACDDESELKHINDRGLPQGSFGWIRVIELMIIAYHFPVIVPTASIRKDNCVPPSIMYLVTPVLYSVILYFFFGRR